MSITLPVWLAVIGVALAVIEFAVLGFSAFFLFFLAVGCLLTSFLMFLGIVPETYLWAAITVAVLSSITMVLLWGPIKRFQEQQQDPSDQPNVFKGLRFRLQEDLQPQGSVNHRYSGIEWQTSKAQEDNETWPAGTEVEVVKTEVGKFLIARV